MVELDKTSNHMIYNKSDLKGIHIELTDKCNAACPLCMRNPGDLGLSPCVKNIELSLEDIKRLIPEEFCKTLNYVYFCGNFGDSLLNTELLDICDYFRYNNVVTQLHTNGGARSEKFWKELAVVLDKIVFAVDGLKDTNHIYRKKVNWDILFRNMNIWSQSGKPARWTFLLFEHNKHQVEEAKNIAENLGFTFETKYSRTLPVNHGMGIIKPDPDFDSDYPWEIPWDSTTEPDNWDFDTMAQCKVKKQAYLSARGEWFPCCWVSSGVYHHRERKPKNYYHFTDKFDFTSFFSDTTVQDFIVDSWQCGDPLRPCKNACNRVL